jgi:hypothetical protein
LEGLTTEVDGTLGAATLRMYWPAGQDASASAGDFDRQSAQPVDSASSNVFMSAGSVTVTSNGSTAPAPVKATRAA